MKAGTIEIEKGEEITLGAGGYTFTVKYNGGDIPSVDIEVPERACGLWGVTSYGTEIRACFHWKAGSEEE